MATKPWMKIYLADRRELARGAVSMAARGFWVECLCIMHAAEPYGHLVHNGYMIDCRTLAKMTGGDYRRVDAMLDELTNAGIFSVTSDGIVFSARMVADAKKSEVGRVSVAKRHTAAYTDRYANVGGNPLKTGNLPNRSPNRSPSRSPIGSSKTMESPRVVYLVKKERKEEEREEERKAQESLASTSITEPPAREAEPPLVACAPIKSGPISHPALGWSEMDQQPSAGNYLLGWLWEQVTDAAGIDEARWRGDMRPLLDWIHEGIEANHIIATIKRVSSRSGYYVPSTLNYFAAAIRSTQQRKVH